MKALVWFGVVLFGLCSACDGAASSQGDNTKVRTTPSKTHEASAVPFHESVATTTSTSTTVRVTTTVATVPPTTIKYYAAPPPPPPSLTAAPQPATAPCHPSYTPCIPDEGTDVDCAGGSGNGPRYVQGPVQVHGYDEYDLDRDGNGVGCES